MLNAAVVCTPMTMHPKSNYFKKLVNVSLIGLDSFNSNIIDFIFLLSLQFK